MTAALALLSVGSLCAAFAAGCGSEAAPGSATDVRGQPASAVQADLSSAAGNDGGCDFATHVLHLFDASTNSTSLPTTNLGTQCHDQRKYSQYKSLFP